MAHTSPFAFLLTLISLTTGIRAIHDPSIPLPRQDATIAPLTPSQIAAFKPYTWYSATTACNISTIVDWSCGDNCDANPNFKPVATGGDGDKTPFWFAGYDPTLDEVIVSHQGTDFTKIKSVLENLLVFQGPLNATLFPGLDKSILVHKDLADAHNRSAPGVVPAVEQALSKYLTNKVTVVGHSGGAAIALLDAVYLPLHLSSNVTVHYIGYGSPRVGNQAFANYVDAQGLSVTRINNKQDPIPVLPATEFFEYHHVSGEIRILNDDTWVSCPGQDNPSDECSTGAINFATTLNVSQHTGPFDGVSMGKC